MKQFISAILPNDFKDNCLAAVNFAKYGLGRQRYCPVCEKHSRRFLHYGLMHRENARCYFCGSLERHRLLWLYLLKRTNLFQKKKIKLLHVAPEKCLEPRFKQLLGDSYITADLDSPHVMQKMDVTDIKCDDRTFDAIYCSHVLEHVQDDKKAMREFYRVLKQDGWAILLVPITAERTFEDPSVVDPAERLRLFGQEDHVRQYGPDYIDRLRDAGFTVEKTEVKDLVPENEATLMGLTAASGEIYYCTKSYV